MAILLFLFIISIGLATFIENSYDTITARVVIFNAKWFELILVLLVINFTNNIRRYNLFSKKKWTMLTIHIGFIVVILGAGVTRYFGYEGVMLIPENKSVSNIFSSDPYFQIFAHNEKQQFTFSDKLFFTPLTDNHFSYDFDFPENKKVVVELQEYIPHAEQVLETNVADGGKLLELVFPGREKVYIKDGQSIKKGQSWISYNNNDKTDAIRFFEDENGFYIFSPFDVIRTDMAMLSVEDRQKSMSDIPMDTLQRDSLHLIGLRNLINIGGTQIMISEIHSKAKLEIRSTINEDVNEDGKLNSFDEDLNQNGKLDFDEDYNGNGTLDTNVNEDANKNGKLDYVNEDLPDAIKLSLALNDQSKDVVIYGGAGLQPKPTMVELGGWFFQLAYGAKSIDLPFQIFLKDFRLLKYPGSQSPSSYESDIAIIDTLIKKNDEYNLFMNNVVDYDGYRFFQSSYDWSEEQNKSAGKDPDITILSVNHDFWGTWLTYFGYLLLAIGFLSTLLNKNSRFLKVRKQIIKMRKNRLVTALLLFLLTSSSVLAQNYQPVEIKHADSFGELLVQSYEGRIQPIHSLAYDVFHKVSKKDQFSIGDSIQLDAMQVFVDFMIDSEFWSKQKLIYVKAGTGVADSLGITGKYASVKDFVNEKGEEKLLNQLNISFNKKDLNKNVFDKELIKVNERFNILVQLMYGSIITIFPIKDDAKNKWVSWNHESSNIPINMSNNHSESGITLSKIWVTYLNDLANAKQTGDYSSASNMLGTLKSIQTLRANKEILPEKALIDLEIGYNKKNIFKSLKNNYGYLAILLLLFSFIDALINNRKSSLFKILNSFLWLLIILLGFTFIYHTYGLGLRWIITDHAPWSNGYEALTFIAWGSVLAGFLFVRNSKITLAATALLAFFILMTAGHSSFDPQLTNLQPVLKSYWLMIHVACITISYGFLGLGFVLGLINLFTFLFKNKSNAKRLSPIIGELTYINEMTLTIGLVLATIGTFLGGIWANESWGRYWGWDAKETWALVIVLTYAIILHFRLIPGMRSKYIFNVASVLGFSSVLMTFIGVNYYLSKGLHSYARGDTPVFPMWAWGTIIFVFLLIIFVGLKERRFNRLNIK